MISTDKIYLVGFMGAGKTSVAQALAARMAWRLEDIDERIEARERMSIAEIFRTRGEPYFRALEREEIYGLLPLRHVVVATGGGTFADADSRSAMLADGTVIWLDVPFTELTERVPTDGRRPLAVDLEQLEQLYLARRVFYQLAHVRLDAGRGPVEELVERILDQLGW